MTYDKENIPADVIKKIEPYIGREDFTPEAIAKVSKACTSICMWARAMHTYYLVSVRYIHIPQEYFSAHVWFQRKRQSFELNVNYL